MDDDKYSSAGQESSSDISGSGRDSSFKDNKAGGDTCGAAELGFRGGLPERLQALQVQSASRFLQREHGLIDDSTVLFGLLVVSNRSGGGWPSHLTLAFRHERQASGALCADGAVIGVDFLRCVIEAKAS